MLRSARHRRPRAGFSLVEMLVVVAIIGILAGLIIPAVQSARESSRRTACQNNIRQIALALLGHESANRQFPEAAVVSDKDACNACFDPWGEAQRTGVTPADDKHGTSWLLEILPRIDALAVFSQWNRATNVLGNATTAQTDIPLLYCPSRRAGIRTTRNDHKNLLSTTWRGGGTDYGGCMGRTDGFVNDASNSITGRHRFAQKNWSGTSGDGRKEGLFRPDGPTAAATLRDGLSNTIAVGELQRLRPLAGTTTSAQDKRTSQDGWAVGGAATLFVTATDPGNGNPGGLNNYFFESPGSDHPGGASFAMADGSVQWFDEFLDARDNNANFPLLGSMRDGEAVTLSSLD
jgi:prepilin-type N-terminal cleavage/methylation domain-containing protein/prepilin-type processing-associated H-X9-DG protein